MELETNTEANGVDVITRQTITKQELVARQEALMNDMNLLMAESTKLQAMINKLPVTEEDETNA